MVPVHVVLVVQGTMVARCHHRIDLVGSSACPWATLGQLGEDLGGERGSIGALSRIWETGDLWLGSFTCLQLVCCWLLHALELWCVLFSAAVRLLHMPGKRSLAFCCLINMTRVATTREPFVVITIRKVGNLSKREKNQHISSNSYTCIGTKNTKHKRRGPLGAHREPVWHQCPPGPA